MTNIALANLQHWQPIEQSIAIVIFMVYRSRMVQISWIDEHMLEYNGFFYCSLEVFLRCQESSLPSIKHSKWITCTWMNIECINNHYNSQIFRTYMLTRLQMLHFAFYQFGPIPIASKSECVSAYSEIYKNPMHFQSHWLHFIAFEWWLAVCFGSTKLGVPLFSTSFGHCLNLIHCRTHTHALNFDENWIQ